MARTKGTIRGVNADNRTGTLMDSKTGDIFTYEQPFLKELGLDVGTEVFYDTVDLGGKSVAISLDNVAKGTVSSILDAETGTLKELATGRELRFRQPYLREAGITIGSYVKFEKINTGTDGETAVLLTVTKKNA
jgi:hypothetical protein